MSTHNPYLQENEKRGGLAPVIPGIQPQYDQPLRRPSSSVSPATKSEQEEQEKAMPLNTQPFPQQQKEPMAIHTQKQPPQQQWPSSLTPPKEQSMPWNTKEQQQQQSSSVSPPQSAHFNQESTTSRPILLTQRHQPPPSPTYEQQHPLAPTHNQQSPQNYPPSSTQGTSPLLTQEHQLQQEEPVASPRTQQMKEKLRERYRLQPEPTKTYSPRQDHAQRYQDISAEHLVENPGGDLALDKIKSGFWKRAGQMQATLGDLSGVESWQDQGRSTEVWADTAYREAESRQRLGEASWLNGEYNVIMGKLTSAIGYVAGDPEMQAKAQLRAREGQEEINRLKR